MAVWTPWGVAPAVRAARPIRHVPAPTVPTSSARMPNHTVPSRTTGVAPLAVYFDATGTDLGSHSYLDATFAWTFDADDVVFSFTVYLDPEVGAINRSTLIVQGEPIKIDKFDYANPDGLQETFDLGLRDGKKFGRSCVLDAGAYSSAP